MAVPFALRVSTADSASHRPSLKMTDARSVAIRNLQTTIYRLFLYLPAILSLIFCKKTAEQFHHLEFDFIGGLFPVGEQTDLGGGEACLG